MTDNRNKKPKEEVPTLTYEQYKKSVNEGKALPRNYKIAEKDKEAFLRDITK